MRETSSVLPSNSEHPNPQIPPSRHGRDTVTGADRIRSGRRWCFHRLRQDNVSSATQKSLSLCSSEDKHRVNVWQKPTETASLSTEVRQQNGNQAKQNTVCRNINNKYTQNTQIITRFNDISSQSEQVGNIRQAWCSRRTLSIWSHVEDGTKQRHTAGDRNRNRRTEGNSSG